MWEYLKHLFNEGFTKPKEYGAVGGVILSSPILLGKIPISNSFWDIIIRVSFIIFSGVIGGFLTQWATQFGKRNPYHETKIYKLFKRLRRGKKIKEDPTEDPFGEERKRNTK